MLLHDNYIPFIVNLQAVVVFHFEVKCTNCIFCFECICIMADNDKTLIGDGNLSNNNRKSSAPSIVPSSAGTMHSDTHPTHQVAVSEPTTLKRKQTSFQITSVTVKGSRLSTEGGEDSADDLDESHTEEVSSDVLDCSRTTDVDNDQLSECSNVNNDESSVHAPSIPVKCKTEQSVEQDAQNNANKFPSESSKDDQLTAPPSETNQSQHVVKPPALPDQWQHRFRVVKIVSSEPFKRGRWLCMDFRDPPAPAVEAKPEVSDSTPSSGTQIIPSTYFQDPTVPTDRVAHIYEISPSDAYPGSISVAVGPDHIQQPMYGIFLPVHNGHYPFISGINTTTVSIHEEAKRPEPPQSATSLVMQQSQGLATSQTFTEAQPSFPCQQTQSISTPASQPVQPPTTIQVCPQHQSQTTVKAPTSATSMQQPAVSAPVIPIPMPVTSNQTAIPPPQSQIIQESQITMQQRVQPPVVLQSHSVPASTTQAHSVASSNATLISSTSQVCELQQNVVNPPTVQQTVINPPVVQQTVVNPSALQQSVINPPGLQQTVVNPPAMQQTVVNPPAMQQTIVNPPALQQTVVNPPVLQQTVVNPPALQQSAVNPPALQQAIINPPALQQTIVNPSVLANASMAGAQTSSVGTQASAAASNIPEVTLAPSIANTEPAAVPSQIIQNHVEVKELGTPPSTNPQQIPESSNEVPPAKSDMNGEDPERLQPRALCSKLLSGFCEYSVPSGTSTVAIDNKIEQAMDLVKSHLMFAVREEVDVLKEKITELMDRISQLEYENGFLRANASQQTLEQLNQSQLLQQQQQQNQPSTISMNSIQVTQQPTSQQQLNIQNPQSTS